MQSVASFQAGVSLQRRHSCIVEGSTDSAGDEVNTRAVPKITPQRQLEIIDYADAEHRRGKH